MDIHISSLRRFAAQLDRSGRGLAPAKMRGMSNRCCGARRPMRFTAPCRRLRSRSGHRDSGRVAFPGRTEHIGPYRIHRRLPLERNVSGRSALITSIQGTSNSPSGYCCRNAHGSPLRALPTNLKHRDARDHERNRTDLKNAYRLTCDPADRRATIGVTYVAPEAATAPSS